MYTVYLSVESLFRRYYISPVRSYLIAHVER